MLAFITLLIVYGSLYPWRFDFSRGHAGALWILLHSWPRHWNRFLLRDAGFNVVLYAPFGAAAFRSLMRRLRPEWGIAVAALLGAALSICMEVLQIYVPGRDSSLLDVVTNTTGAAAGALAVAVWRVEIERRLRGLHDVPRRRYVGPLVLLCCWAGYQWYPFFPALARTPLGAAVSAVFHGHPFQPVEVLAAAAECFTVALLLETCWPDISWVWVTLALAGCIGRLLIHGRVLSAEEIVGAAAALWLWLASPLRKRPGIALGLLGLAILLRELAPYHFIASPAPFGWIPFVASMKADREAALLVLLRKAFDYGSMSWLLFRGGVPYHVSGPAVAAVLLVCEWIQRYIPGRTPETTDAVLALLMTGLLAVLARRDNQQYEL